MLIFLKELDRQTDFRIIYHKLCKQVRLDQRLHWWPLQCVWRTAALARYSWQLLEKVPIFQEAKLTRCTDWSHVIRKSGGWCCFGKLLVLRDKRRFGHCHVNLHSGHVISKDSSPEEWRLPWNIWWSVVWSQDPGEGVPRRRNWL